MYIWIALYLEDELSDYKKSILKNSKRLGYPLPPHHSANPPFPEKTFDVKDAMTDKCIQEICRFFNNQSPFYIEPECYEINPGILWLKVKDSDKLKELHSGLDSIVKEYFGVDPTEMDNNIVSYSFKEMTVEHAGDGIKLNIFFVRNNPLLWLYLIVSHSVSMCTAISGCLRLLREHY